MSKLVDLDHKWAKEIGRVFIAFGSIEHITIECLKDIPRDNIFETTKHLNLGQRIDLIIEILSTFKEKDVIKFVTLLKKAKTLSIERNLIAHNPLMLNVYGNEIGEYKLEEKITSMKNTNKHMTFEKLQSLANESEDLSSSFYGKLSKVLLIVSSTNA